MKFRNLIVAILLSLSLSGCVGAVVGVAVDTTVAVVKAPLKIAGAVVGVAADTTGTVIAAPFRVANAAVGGSAHDHHEHNGFAERGENHEYEYSGEHPRDGREH